MRSGGAPTTIGTIPHRRRSIAVEISDIDASPPETASHHWKLHDARAADLQRLDPPRYPRETDEHGESHLVRGYD